MKGNILYTIGSILVALILWMVVQPLSEPGREREFEVPLTYRALPDNLMVMSLPDKVTLIAEGTATHLDRLDTSSVKAYVDLGGATPGERRYPVKTMGPLGSGVTLSLRTPRALATIERLRQVEFPVELQYSGAPPSGYEVAASSIMPERVTVSVPESLAPNVKKVRALLDLSRVRPGGAYEVKVEVLGQESRPVPLSTTSPSAVTVSPAVTAAAVTKRAIVVPNWEGEPAYGYRVRGYTIAPVQVEVQGQSALLANLTTIETQPISIEGLRGSRVFRVGLDVPRGVRIHGSSNVTASVRIAKGSHAGPAKGSVRR